MRAARNVTMGTTGKRACLAALIAASALTMPFAQSRGFSPARLRTGGTPALPANVIGGGEVFLEASVDSMGHVTAVTPLRTTPPFADLLAGVVRDWQFRPAEDDDPATRDGERKRVPVPSKVLVVGEFRPPTLYGPTAGEPYKDVGAGSGETPFPVTTAVAPFPPLAYSSGVVALEATVDQSGRVTDVTVVHSAPPFDDPARSAVRQWTFRPARVHGTPVSAPVYLVLGFPVPIGPGPTATPR